MGIFDFFKRNVNNADSPEPKISEEKIDSSNEVSKVKEQIPPAQTPPAQTPPAPTAVPEKRKYDTDGGNKQAFLSWPKMGSPSGSLIFAYKFRIFVDASCIRSAGFSEFIGKWKDGKTGNNANRFFFISSSEKEKLSEEELKKIPSDCYREFYGKDIEDCFTQMKKRELKWNIVWLTNDAEIASQAKKCAEQNDIQLRWYGITKGGTLCKVGQSEIKKGDAVHNGNEVQPLFMQTQNFVQIERAVNFPSAVPSTFADVYASGTKVRYKLSDAVMSDHVSITYKTNDPLYFAKIYTAQTLRTNMFEKKAKRMLQTPVQIEGVCWPKDILTDTSGIFVGVLVPASHGVQLTKSVFAGQSGLKQNFPQWNKQDICKLAITIVSTICRLQALGVYFGCINPSSLYVENSTKVYFVDMDEMQIEGYPVLSQNLTFTLPERVDMPKTLHLSNRDEENYQTALLIFMILMPGKYPYAKRRRTSEIDSIRNMSFPFSIGKMQKSQDSESPGGIWQIVWDHIPFNLCDSFYNTFTKSGTHASPGKRLSASAWLSMLLAFEKRLENPNNADSREMFPKTFRRDEKRSFCRCSICGQEHPDFYFLKKIHIQKETVDIWANGYRVCLPCAVDQSPDPNARFTCESCGRTFYYTNRTKIVHDIGKLDFDWKNQRWCKDCKKRTSKCTRCGKEVPFYQIREFEDRMRNQRYRVCPNCFTSLIDEVKRRKRW